MPQITGYPNCCGASIITGFTGTPDSPVQSQYGYNPSTARYETTKSKETQGENLLKKLSGGYANRMYTCILTVGQYRYWGKWLKANGFIFTNRFVNSVHNSTLYHFAYIKKSKSCKVVPLQEPGGWSKYPGPTPNTESSKDEVTVPPSVETVAA